MPLRLSVDHHGVTSDLPPAAQLVFLGFGAMIQMSLVLAANAGVADLLAEGPRSADDLARATSSHPRALYRVLRLLASFGIFTEIATGRFAQTPLSELLRGGVPGSLRSWIRMMGFPVYMQSWTESPYSLRTGEPAFDAVVGEKPFEYFAANRKEGELFDAAMDDFGRAVAAAVVGAYDFRGIDTIADIGGGHGTLLSPILDANPGMNGLLFDLPHVAEGARPLVRAAGLADRCEILCGDFFQSVPSGADAYALRWIIHDWSRDRALAILRNCRAAMKPNGRLLLVEAVLPAGDEPHPSKVLDFGMLAAFGGEERTEAEYAELLREAGFRLARVVPTASPLSVIEGVLA
jgi:hypothetical protein